MNMIFQDAKDKYVTGVLFYADGSKKLFADAEGSVAAKAADALDAFLKGVLVISDSGAYLRPTKVDGTTISVGATEYSVEE